jgi:molybdopterin synthase catalytic subunit
LKLGKKKHGLIDAQIIQAEGSFKPGEILDLVALAGSSRKEVFSALRDVTDAAKNVPCIYRKESYETE